MKFLAFDPTTSGSKLIRGSLDAECFIKAVELAKEKYGCIYSITNSGFMSRDGAIDVIPAYLVEDERFVTAKDQLGIMAWQAFLHS